MTQKGRVSRRCQGKLAEEAVKRGDDQPSKKEAAREKRGDQKGCQKRRGRVPRGGIFDFNDLLRVIKKGENRHGESL